MTNDNLLQEPLTDNKIIIYQLFVRLFGNQNSTRKWAGTLDENGTGKFADINDKALDALVQMGITHVWYTGIIEHALTTDYSAYGIKPDHPTVVKGRAGSPYAIKDYYDVNPDLAVDVNQRMAEFEALLARTHAKGLNVIIDFVPNHVARGYHSDAKPGHVQDLGATDDSNVHFSTQNDFYYFPGESFCVPQDYDPKQYGITYNGTFEEYPAKVTGNSVLKAQPHLHDWFETIKLNFGVNIFEADKAYFSPIPSAWHKLRDILLFWADKGVDGFRCDMVEMTPVAFWNWVIPQIKKIRPSVKFIAEVYNPNLYRNYIIDGRFDYLYDKVGLYDTIRSVMAGWGNANFLSQCWRNLKGINGNMLRFMENHDEYRIASKHFAGNAWAGIPGMVLSATLGTGPVMIYGGQEVGEPAEGSEGFSGDDGKSSIFDYWSMPEMQKWVNNGAYDGGGLSPEQHKLREFYVKLLQTCKQQEAIRQGRMYDIQTANQGRSYGYNDSKAYAFLRFTENEQLLIIVNFEQEHSGEAWVKIPEEAWQLMGLDVNQKYAAWELLSNKEMVNFYANETIDLNNVKAGIRLPMEPLCGYIYKLNLI